MVQQPRVNGGKMACPKAALTDVRVDACQETLAVDVVRKAIDSVRELDWIGLQHTRRVAVPGRDNALLPWQVSAADDSQYEQTATLNEISVCLSFTIHTLVLLLLRSPNFPSLSSFL